MAGPVVTTLLQAIALLLLLAGCACLVLLVKGCSVLRRLSRESYRDDTAIILRSPLSPPVTVIASPADGSAKSRQFARRLLGLHSATHDLVLVLNGLSETDNAAWKREFHLIPSNRMVGGPLPAGKVRGIYESTDPIPLAVLDLERSTAAMALNAGVNAASSSVIAIFDAEAEFQAESLLYMIRPMLEKPGETIGVCAVAPAPLGIGMAGRFAALGFMRLWLGRCAAFAGWNMLLPVPGCAMLISREAIVDIGGFRAGPVGLFLDLHFKARASRKPYRIVLLPESLSYAPAPHSLAELHKLIARDQREIAAAWRSGKSALGWWGLPALLAIRFLSPVLEIFALALTAVGLALGWVEWRVAVLVLISTVGMGIVVSMAAVVSRELAESRNSDPGRLASLFFAAIPENLWFRQMQNVWLISGFFKRQPSNR
jgi:cellulose synthase/poly-beta-1,6-N-acetylglucosamine synthase-like glycosyltransferase